MAKVFILLIAIMIFLSGCNKSSNVSKESNIESSVSVTEETIDENTSQEETTTEIIADQITTEQTTEVLTDEIITDQSSTEIITETTIQKETATVESTTQKETTKAESTTQKEITTVEPTTRKETTTATSTTRKEITTVESTVQQETTTVKPITQKETTTEKQTTTIQPTTTPVIETTTMRYFVDFVKEISTVTSDYKYGVIQITNISDTYLLFSDGTKELSYTYSYNTYNYDGYNATDAQLMDESNTKTVANMDFYNEVLMLVNEIRAEAGVAPLILDTTLCQAATVRAIEMNYSNLYSHTRPYGGSCFSVFDLYNIDYWCCGENIAAGYSSAQSVVNGWKNSEGHYANMINADFTKLGVGMSDEESGDYGMYWVQLFTN